LSIVTAIACLGLGAPAYADTPTTTLKVEASFDQPAYASGSDVKITLKITNTGNVPAEKVVGNSYGSPSVSLDWPYWGDLDYHKGVDIQPGETRVFQLSGYVGRVTDTALFQGYITAANRPTQPSLPEFTLTAPVHTATTDWRGTVYTDTNENGRLDFGEALSGVKVHLTGGVPDAAHDMITNSVGEFTYSDLPTGRYYVYYEALDGWIVNPPENQPFRLTEGSNASVLVPAVRPLSERLRATIKFAQDTYQPGDTVHAKVTLTNTGTRTITGIVAHCNGIGNDDQLNGGPGWGALDYGASGVAVEPGKKTVVDVSEAVPAGSLKSGEVAVGCEFGPAGYLDGYPVGSYRARVPGTLGAVNVTVTRADGSPAPGVQFRVIDPFTKAVIARPVTDANGKFELHDVQTGNYDVRVSGRWKIDSPWGPPNITVRTPIWNDFITVVPTA
jgi:hypothetical protein